MARISTSASKCVLYFVNLLILLCGIFYTYVGFIIHNSFAPDWESMNKYSLVAGLVAIVIAIFGSYGVWTENYYVLTTYSAILITMFVIQLVFGVLTFIAVENGSTKKKVHFFLRGPYKGYNLNKYDTETVDHLQQTLQCCGFTGTDDHKIQEGPYLTASCCPKANSGPCKQEMAFRTSCFDKLLVWLNRNISFNRAIEIIFCMSVLFAAIFTCLLNKRRS